MNCFTSILSLVCCFFPYRISKLILLLWFLITDCINEELEAMIAVHILVSTADVLLNCCFESAIIHLSEMIENDSSIQGKLTFKKNYEKAI